MTYCSQRSKRNTTSHFWPRHPLLAVLSQEAAAVLICACEGGLLHQFKHPGGPPLGARLLTQELQKRSVDDHERLAGVRRSTESTVDTFWNARARA
eukprot:10398413-Alexandrium_andersonii.AAC.1